MLDTKKRTIVKTISDKVMEIGLSALIMKVCGLPNALVVGLPLLIEISQITCYLINERIWNKIEWQTSHEMHLCEKCKIPNCPCPVHAEVLKKEVKEDGTPEET